MDNSDLSKIVSALDSAVKIINFLDAQNKRLERKIERLEEIHGDEIEEYEKENGQFGVGA